MWQGFSHFPSFLHHFVMAKLAASSIRVKREVSLASKCFFLQKHIHVPLNVCTMLKA